jgi:hypothetical protein
MGDATIVDQGRDGREAPLSRYLDENEPSAGEWQVRLRVNAAGEATVKTFQKPNRPKKRFPSTCKGYGTRSQIAALIAKAENVERAGRRARGEMRRYCVHNMLRYMWTLTYAGPGEMDHRQAMADAKRFVRKVKARFGVDVYLFSPEPHPGACSVCGKSKCGHDAPRLEGHGWHTNLFVNRPLPQRVMKKLWMDLGPQHGYEVRYKDWGRDRSKGASLRERVRAAAGYAAKYGSKGVEELAVYGVNMREGEHRYVTARGKTPRWTVVSAPSIVAALAGLTECYGRIVRIIDLEQQYGGGMWVRFLPRPPDETEPS